MWHKMMFTCPNRIILTKGKYWVLFGHVNVLKRLHTLGIQDNNQWNGMRCRICSDITRVALPSICLHYEQETIHYLSNHLTQHTYITSNLEYVYPRSFSALTSGYIVFPPSTPYSSTPERAPQRLLISNFPCPGAYSKTGAQLTSGALSGK